MLVYVCTLVQVLVGRKKQQVAGDAHCKCKWGLCAIWWQEKHHQCKLQRVKTILVTSRSRMQQPIAACTRAQSLTRPCPCATCIWLLHPVPTSAQDGLDPLRLALVVFFLPSISVKISLALAVYSICNLCWWCFLVLTSALSKVHTWLASIDPAATHCNLHWWYFSSTNQAFTNVHTCSDMWWYMCI